MEYFKERQKLLEAEVLGLVLKYWNEHWKWRKISVEAALRGNKVQEEKQRITRRKQVWNVSWSKGQMQGELSSSQTEYSWDARGFCELKAAEGSVGFRHFCG